MALFLSVLIFVEVCLFGISTSQTECDTSPQPNNICFRVIRDVEKVNKYVIRFECCSEVGVGGSWSDSVATTTSKPTIGGMVIKPYPGRRKRQSLPTVCGCIREVEEVVIRCEEGCCDGWMYDANGECTQKIPEVTTPSGPRARTRFLNCPEDLVHVNVSEGTNIASLDTDSLGLQAVDYNGDPLTIFFSETTFTASFKKLNSHQITAHSAADDQSDEAICRFTLVVHDPFPPHFTYCPNNLTINQGEAATWAMPTAKDNVGLSSHISQVTGVQRGSTFLEPVTYLIQYEVTDLDGNGAICTFYINVIAATTTTSSTTSTTSPPTTTPSTTTTTTSTTTVETTRAATTQSPGSLNTEQEFLVSPEDNKWIIPSAVVIGLLLLILIVIGLILLCRRRKNVPVNRSLPEGPPPDYSYSVSDQAVTAADPYVNPRLISNVNVGGKEDHIYDYINPAEVIDQKKQSGHPPEEMRVDLGPPTAHGISPKVYDNASDFKRS